MEFVEKSNNILHITLRELIRRKSKRDRFEFTIYQLANELDMPRSMLVRLMHTDPEKRVHNPRIDTLAKIVEFFKTDGFNITIDELLYGFKDHSVDVPSQESGTFSIQKRVPLYSFNIVQEDLGFIDVKLTQSLKKTIALRSDEDIKPMFKKGSIFILDTELEPENDTLIAVKIEGYNKILIRKFYLDGHKKLLKSYSDEIKPVILTPTLQYQILGIVIQVNAKT